jgi:hypothetical protein
MLAAIARSCSFYTLDKERHATGVRTNTATSGFFPSRMATTGPRSATSTRLPELPE